MCMYSNIYKCIYVIYQNIYIIGPNFHNAVSKVLLSPFYP